jgi:hypothetical protein
MFAHDADLRLLGVSIFKPVGEPVRVCISHDHDLDCSVLARRRWRCVRVIGGLLSFRLPRPFPLPRISRGFPLALAPKATRAITPEAAEGIGRPQNSDRLGGERASNSKEAPNGCVDSLGAYV